MFQKLFGKKEPVRLYRGAVVVASNGESNPHPFGFWTTDYDAYLKEKLSSLLSLPEFDKNQTSSENAYCMDLMILDYQLGGVNHVDLWVYDFLLFWRPKISIAIRVYRVKDDRTRYSETLRLAMPWREYFKNLVLIRNNLLNEKGVERMLYQGCLKLLSNAKYELNL